MRGWGEGDVKGQVAWLSGSDSVQYAQPLRESRMGKAAREAPSQEAVRAGQRARQADAGVRGWGQGAVRTQARGGRKSLSLSPGNRSPTLSTAKDCPEVRGQQSQRSTSKVIPEAKLDPQGSLAPPQIFCPPLLSWPEE